LLEVAVLVHVLFAILLCPPHLLASPAQELPRGTIVDKVICRGNASQSYALYLPSGYSTDRQWPILYAFDAGARGRLPVERFRGAAETYGFIVVGSNNSHNGPLTIAQDAINAMLADTRARFSLDHQRVYVTGFSGGARVAVMAGLAMKGQVAGVIGFGAGFPAGVAPSASVPFAYFTAAGTDDFNYPELKELDQVFGKLGLLHRFELFEGGHDWPPEAVCARAVEWMVTRTWSHCEERPHFARSSTSSGNDSERYPANLYPSPWIVRMNCGCRGLASIFCRSHATWTSTVRVEGIE
jgi:dienelactone hydrolase